MSKGLDTGTQKRLLLHTFYIIPTVTQVKIHDNNSTRNAETKYVFKGF